MSTRILSVAQIAIQFETSEDIIKNLIECGDLPAFGTRKHLIRECDINKFFEETPANSSIDIGNTIMLQYIQLLTDNVTDKEVEMAIAKYGEGSVYQNEKRGCYQAAFYITMLDGTKKRKIVSGRTEVEVVSKMTVLKLAADSSTSTSLPVMPVIMSTAIPTPKPEIRKTVAEVFDEFMESKQMCAKNTIQSYRYAGNDIIKYMGDQYIDEITTKQIEQFLKDKAKRRTDGKFSESTFVIRRKTLSGMFQWAQKYKYILPGSNPMQYGICLPEHKKTDRDSKCLTAKQVEQVLNCLSEHPRYKTIVKILVTTGLRIAELIALKWDDIEMKKDENGKKGYFLHIQRAAKLNPDFIANDSDHPRYILGEPKSKESNRYVPITPEILDILYTWKETVQANEALMEKIYANKTQELVFTNDQGQLINYQTLRYHFGEYLDTAYKKAVQGTKSADNSENMKFPFKVTFHMFRHTYGSLLLEQKVDIAIVSRFLGHSSISITADIYTTITDTPKMKIAPCVENILTMCGMSK